MSVARRKDPLKVVLDTNVYFSAFDSTRGVPLELWLRAVRREYTLLISPDIVRELAEVLRRDLHWPEADIVTQLKVLVRVATIVEPKIALAAVAADPDDDRILECAVAGDADLIVSGDRHLTALNALSRHRDCMAGRLPADARDVVRRITGISSRLNHWKHGARTQRAGHTPASPCYNRRGLNEIAQ